MTVKEFLEIKPELKKIFIEVFGAAPSDLSMFILCRDFIKSKEAGAA